jgi:hypothetical protein
LFLKIPIFCVWWGSTGLKHLAYSDVVVDDNLFILVLQPGSSLERPNNAFQLHSVRLVFQFLTPLCLRPSSILSNRLTGCHPTFLVPSGFVNVIFLQGQSPSFLNSCPSHLVLLVVILKWLQAPYIIGTIRDLTKFAILHLPLLGHIYSSELFFQLC